SSLFNLSIVIAAFFVDKNNPHETLYYFSYFIVLSGIAQLILHIIVFYNNRILKAMKLSLKFRKTKTNLKSFYGNFFHGILGSSATQFSSLLDTTIASFLITGSISYLYYANRIFQLPLALFAIALTQVAFPKILKYLKSNQEELALEFMKKALAFLSILLIFSSMIGIIFAKEITKILFERGNFSNEDALITAYVLIAYLLGLLPFGLQKILSLWLYAKFKQKTAAFIAFKALILSALCSIVFILFIQDEKNKILAVALSSSISAFYLLLANIKEFGFKKFFSLISWKFCILFFAIFALVVILLLEFKTNIIFVFVYIFEFIKGIIQ
ncbi:murein biosynthesis integral membrane protein MurJ, partial [Campylobacter novaezeelandiae]